MPLPLPLGEVAERSEDGEGEQDSARSKSCKTLSVTCGDSSPRGRAMAVKKARRVPHAPPAPWKGCFFIMQIPGTHGQNGRSSR